MIKKAYEDLANAIIIQAVKDVRKGNKYAAGARQFLKSEWCGMLSKVDGRTILRRLEEEMSGRTKRKRKAEVL